MAFLFRRTPSAQPTHQSEVERIRDRQLASLIRAGGKPENAQQTKFLVPVRLPQNEILHLQVNIPHAFPSQPPVVTVMTSVQHAWVNTEGRVMGHRDLNVWSTHHDLGRIVGDIIAEFVRCPPRVLNASPQESPLPYQIPGGTNQSTSSMEQQVAQKVEKMNSQIPDIPATFPSLQQLSVAEMEELMQNKEKMKEYVRSLNNVVTYLKFYDDIIQGNKEIAEKNLSYSSELTTLQTRIADRKKEYQDHATSLINLQQQQAQLQSKKDPKALLEKVNNAIQAADMASEATAQQFTNGEVSLSEFTSTYLQQRTNYHHLNAKYLCFTNNTSH